MSVLLTGCGKTTKATSENREEGSSAVQARPNSKVEVVSDEYDFGVMELGKTGKHTFTLTNIGDEPLEIKQGTTTCKCTLSGMTAGGKTVGKDGTLVLKKGESASIELEWTPKEHSPSFSELATIHTSDPDRPTVELHIKGQVHSILTLSPLDSWSIGSIDGNRIGEFSGTLTSKILNSFDISNITCDDGKLIDRWTLWDGTEFRRFTSTDGDFLVETTPMSSEQLRQQQQQQPPPSMTQEPQQPQPFLSGYVIVVRVLPSYSVGQFKHRLAITTDARDELVFRPEVTGVRTGPMLIFALPGTVWGRGSMRLSLGRFSARKGGKAELLLYVGGLGKQELEIDKVDADSQDLKVELKPSDFPGSVGKKPSDSPGQRKFYRLVFSVPAGANPATRTGTQAVTVKLYTNHKRIQSMTLSVVYYNSY